VIGLGDAEKSRELLAFLEDAPPGRRAPYLEAQAHRFRARLKGTEAEYETAARFFRELELSFWLG
jgi:hypothetical protein